MKPFEYFEPRTVPEATKLLSNYGGKARILAGGIDLIPRMRKGGVKPEYVINIQKVTGLEYIGPEGKKGFKFGAIAKLHSIETSKTIQNRYPILRSDPSDHFRSNEIYGNGRRESLCGDTGF